MEKAPIPLARDEHASCAVGHHVYVFGGASEHTPEAPVEARTDEYDVRADSWQSREDMPRARINHTADAIDGKCYLVGGETGATRRRLDIYDPATDSWQRGADAPIGLEGHTSAVMDGKLYIIEGNPGLQQSALLIYDPASDSWSQGADMPTPRSLAAAAALNGKLYVMGGSLGGFVTSDIVEAYDPATGTWSEGAPMPTNLFYHAAVAVEDAIWVIGGVAINQTVDEVSIYNPANDRWTAGTPLPEPRNRQAMEVVDGEVLLFGGAARAAGNPHETKDSVIAWRFAEPADPFAINPGLNDAWFNSLTAGQGFFIIVFEDTGIIFMAWFTYDTVLPPEDVIALLGAAEHRWLTAQGPYEGDTATLDVFLTEGGIFDMSEPAPTTGESIGTITIVWNDCESGVLTYEIDPPGVSGEILITRIVPDNVALCEALAAMGSE